MNPWTDVYARLAQVDELLREAQAQRQLRQAVEAQSALDPQASRITRLGHWVKGLTWLL